MRQVVEEVAFGDVVIVLSAGEVPTCGRPDACVRSWRMVIGAESRVGYRRAASSGNVRVIGSSSDSLPASRSFRMARPVNVFVIDPMRNTVSASTGRLSSRSATPKPFA